MNSSSKMIKVFLVEHDISQSRLAKMLNHTPQNLGEKLSKNDLSLDLLIEISQKLNHNFLYDMAKQIGVKYEEANLANVSIDDVISAKITKELSKYKVQQKHEKVYPLHDIKPSQLNEPEPDHK